MTSLSTVPDGYGGLVDAVGVEVRTTRLRAARSANTVLVRLYWRIGRLILDRQQAQPWGSKVIRQLAADLRREFPDMTGLSATNLQYMRAFAAAWSAEPISPQPVGTLPWGHVRALLAQPGPVLRRGRLRLELADLGTRARRSLSPNRHGPGECLRNNVVAPELDNDESKPTSVIALKLDNADRRPQVDDGSTSLRSLTPAWLTVRGAALELERVQVSPELFGRCAPPLATPPAVEINLDRPLKR